MDKLPQPFWANILAFQGAALCIVALVYPSKENLALAVIAVGSNLVSGALGAFAGHNQGYKQGMADASKNPSLPATPAQP